MLTVDPPRCTPAVLDRVAHAGNELATHCQHDMRVPGGEIKPPGPCCPHSPPLLDCAQAELIEGESSDAQVARNFLEDRWTDSGEERLDREWWVDRGQGEENRLKG